MKKLKQFFPRTRPSVVLNTLDRHHVRLEDPEKVQFSNINIVTGPNGAGKTRFLNALLELYRKLPDTDVLYGYFPGLSAAKPPKPEDGQLRPYTFQQYQIYPKADFEDFFREIEVQNETFIYQLLIHHSQLEETQNTETFDLVARFFADLTGKRLEQDGDGLTVVDAAGAHTPLWEALEWLSPGERMLFYMSIFLALKRDLRSRRVIILDEPESHLYPEALLKFVRTLTGTFSGADIWIATHSLFLLPEFQFENIVYLKDGVVLRRNSGLYRTALSGLLGEGNENVQRFFASLPHWQYFEFISECFTDPAVISTVNPKDEQVQIFIDALKKQETTRVLDCGGGSGRLGLSMMKADCAEWGNVAYEIYDAQPAYKGKEFKVYKRLEDAPGKYDCVVMMNFLHEVPPGEWHEWFRKVYNLMAPGGSLLFVEVPLQTGEWPNDAGYLVLGKEELAALFDTEDDLTEIRVSDRQKSVGILVAREYLPNVSRATVSAAIQHLEKRSYDELRKIREEERVRREAAKSKKKPDAEDEKKRELDARRYAFFSQQYINAKLFNDAEKERQGQWEYKLTGIVAGEVPAKKPAQKKLFGTSAGDKLKQILNRIDILLADEHTIAPETCLKVGIYFRDTAAKFLAGDNSLKDRLDYCYTLTRALEDNGADKRLIANLLRAEILMGDPRAKAKYDMQKYEKYL